MNISTENPKDENNNSSIEIVNNSQMNSIQSESNEEPEAVSSSIEIESGNLIDPDVVKAELIQSESNEEPEAVSSSIEIENDKQYNKKELEIKKTCDEKSMKSFKRAIMELKRLKAPPHLVKSVMETTCILFNLKPDWKNSQKLLSDSNFLKNLESFDKDNISQSKMNKLKPYIESQEFNIERIKSVSAAAAGIASYVLEIYNNSCSSQSSKDTKLTNKLVQSNGSVESDEIKINTEVNNSNEELKNINTCKELESNAKVYLETKNTSITKGDITELKALKSPPQLVKSVMDTICILLDQSTDWKNSQKLLADPKKLLENLESFDKDNISQSKMNKLKPYIESQEFNIDRVKSVSAAAAGIASYVLEIYNNSLNINSQISKDTDSSFEAVLSTTNKSINIKCPKSAPPLIKKKSPVKLISKSTTSSSINNEQVNQLNETIVKMTQLLLAKEEEIQKLRSMLDK